MWVISTSSSLISISGPRRCNWTGSKPVPDDFEYNSGTNPRFLYDRKR